MAKRRVWRWIASMTAAVVLAGVVGSAAWAQPVGKIVNADAPDAVSGSYLVVLREPATGAGKVAAAAGTVAGRYGGEVTHTYQSINGFAVAMSADRARRLAGDPDVEYVEQDRMVYPEFIFNNPPSWGQDRIDQRALPLDNAFSYPTTGHRVNAYVIDSGIRITHQDFYGRASYGWDFVDNDPIADDCFDHGTAVAGVFAGAALHSVAKLANVVSVRVMGCSPPALSTIVTAGIDWVTTNAVLPAVANLSLGATGSTPTQERAIQAAIDAGITFVTSAGNDDADACNHSPGGFVPDAINVAGSTEMDARVGNSNFGPCVDIFAPGGGFAGIATLDITSDTATQVVTNSTSIAAPHVAGAAALVLEAHPFYEPDDVADVLFNDATTGVITDAGAGSPNRLLHVWDGPIISLDCERRRGLFFCSLLTYATLVSTIRWQVNASPRPGWDDDRHVNDECVIGRHYLVAVTVTDTMGRTASRSYSFICPRESSHL